MAPRTVLQIINTVQQELGLPISATVIGNTDLTTIQLLSFLQAANEELTAASDEGWKALQFEFNLVVNPPLQTTGNTIINSPIITNIPNTSTLSANYWAIAGNNIPQAARILSVDSSTQITMTMEATATEVGTQLNFAQDTYQMPSKFLKYTNATWWDRTNRWQLLGPSSAQLDQWHRSGIVAFGPRRYFRNIGPFSNTYRLWPPPAEIVDPLQLVFEYITSASIMLTGNPNTRSAFIVNDTDVFILDDRALIYGIKWRMWEQKGFAWQSKRNEYDMYVSRLMARDGGAETLSMVKSEPSIYITPLNVQDGYFPGPGLPGWIGS